MRLITCLPLVSLLLLLSQIQMAWQKIETAWHETHAFLNWSNIAGIRNQYNHKHANKRCNGFGITVWVYGGVIWFEAPLVCTNIPNLWIPSIRDGILNLHQLASFHSQILPKIQLQNSLDLWSLIKNPEVYQILSPVLFSRIGRRKKPAVVLSPYVGIETMLSWEFSLRSIHFLSLLKLPYSGYALWSTNIAMETHHF